MKHRPTLIALVLAGAALFATGADRLAGASASPAGRHRAPTVPDEVAVRLMLRAVAARGKGPIDANHARAASYLARGTFSAADVARVVAVAEEFEREPVALESLGRHLVERLGTPLYRELLAYAREHVSGRIRRVGQESAGALSALSVAAHGQAYRLFFRSIVGPADTSAEARRGRVRSLFRTCDQDFTDEEVNRILRIAEGFVSRLTRIEESQRAIDSSPRGGTKCRVNVERETAWLLKALPGRLGPELHEKLARYIAERVVPNIKTVSAQ